jgi:hypothetical protein
VLLTPSTAESVSPHPICKYSVDSRVFSVVLEVIVLALLRGFSLLFGESPAIWRLEVTRVVFYPCEFER